MAFCEEDWGIKEHQKDGCLKDALDRQLEAQNKETSEPPSRCAPLCVCVCVRGHRCRSPKITVTVTVCPDVAFVAMGM